ncbi:MAG: hypothetical protein ABIN97_19610 [Ginsengibacter sp.]
MRRKTFVKNAAFLLTGILLSPGKIFSRKALGAGDQKIWLELIDYARWSPSPHNVQPWKLKIISKTQASLFYDPMRLLINTDPTSAFTITGMSMFIECINIAANPLGYKVIARHEAEQHLDYSSKTMKLFAELTLVERDIKEFPERELIRKRKTSRLHYDGEILKNEVIESLKTVAAEYGFHFNYSANAEIINYILKLNEETLFYDIADERSRIELGKLIRTTHKQAEEKKDGLWSRCMRFPGGLMHNFFFHHERFNSKWKRKILSSVYLKSMTGTANVCWISGNFKTRADWVNAGIMFQRLWIEMTKFNVYLHPFGSVITNPIAYEKFKLKINHSGSKGELWMLARMGYSHQPPRSFRLETSDIILPS